MIRFCIGFGLLGCFLVSVADLSACCRRRGPAICCPCVPIFEVPSPAPSTGAPESRGETGELTAQELQWWRWLTMNGVDQADFDLVWKNSTPAKRKQFYDNIKKTVDDANEKAQKELKDKENKEKESKDGKNDEKPPQVRAIIEVRLPAEAKLFADNVPVNATGSIRVLRTPIIEMGSLYSYEFKVELTRQGKIYTESKTVVIDPSQRTVVSFADLTGNPSTSFVTSDR